MKRAKKTRIRSKRLADLDETKMSLAVYLMTCDLADGDVPPPPPNSVEDDDFDGVDGEDA